MNPLNLNLTPLGTVHARWAMGVVALIVAALVVVHVRDGHRDAELVKLHQTIAADSALRVAAVKRTDAVIAKADTDVTTSARADTVWLRAKAAAATVPQILASPAHDTVKIRELVAIDSMLVVAGDSLRASNVNLRADVAGIQTQLGAERAAWQKERSDQATALAVSESRSRHWGFGCGGGMAIERDPNGSLHSGPAVVCGAVYRF